MRESERESHACQAKVRRVDVQASQPASQQEKVTRLTTTWQPTVAHAAPAMPRRGGPSTRNQSPTRLTSDASSMAAAGLRLSLAPRHDACADSSTRLAGKERARIFT